MCEKLPSPLDLSETRVERLMLTHNKKFSALPTQTQDLKRSFLNCTSQDDAPVIVFVSKMFAVDAESLPENRPKPLSQEEMLARREQARQKLTEKLSKVNGQSEMTEMKDDNINTSEKDDNDNSIATTAVDDEKHNFIAFARVYSGTIRRNSKLYVLGPKHDPTTINNKVGATQSYLLL